MEIGSIGSPLMMIASLAFTILLAFSASIVQSESTTGKPPPPPSKFLTSPPPPSPPPRPPPLPPAPRPLEPGYGHHKPPPPDEKGAKSTTEKRNGLNAGEIVGLVFSGIAMILQIGVVGYLTYKRKQLYHAPAWKNKQEFNWIGLIALENPPAARTREFRSNKSLRNLFAMIDELGNAASFRNR